MHCAMQIATPEWPSDPNCRTWTSLLASRLTASRNARTSARGRGIPATRSLSGTPRRERERERQRKAGCSFLQSRAGYREIVRRAGAREGKPLDEDDDARHVTRVSNRNERPRVTYRASYRCLRLTVYVFLMVQNRRQGQRNVRARL